MFTNFEFNQGTDFIPEYNLPQDYLAFMHQHNGGEGPVGKNAYMQLVPLEELVSFNKDYEIEKYLPDIILFGTDLGGTLFGYDTKKKMYAAIDACSMSGEDVWYKGKTFNEFIAAVDQGDL